MKIAQISNPTTSKKTIVLITLDTVSAIIMDYSIITPLTQLSSRRFTILVKKMRSLKFMKALITTFVLVYANGIFAEV